MDDTKKVIKATVSKDGDIVISPGYSDATLVKQIFGRMHFTKEYTKLVYPFTPAIFSLARAKDYKFGTKIEETSIPITEEVDVPIAEDVFEKMFKQLYDYNNLDKVISQRIGDDLPAEDIAAITDSFKESVEKMLKGKTKKKKVTRNEVKTSLIIIAAFEFDEVIIQFEGTAANAIKLVHPLVLLTKERVEKIREWRENGVPESERDFEVTGEFEPFDHQWVMYKIHDLIPKSANLSQMGTGKSYAVLMSIDMRLKRGQITSGNILIVAPTTTMQNWQKEIRRHTPHLTSQIISGSYRERMEVFLTDPSERADILLINYESFAMVAKENNGNGDGGEQSIPLAAIMRYVDWEMVILDECHKIKNPKAKRTGFLMYTFKDADYKIIMSGTINANKLVDVHMPFVFLNRAKQFNSIQNQAHDGKPLTFSHLHESFSSAYFIREGWKFVPRRGTVKELRERMEEISVRFEKDECLTLPAKMYDMRTLKMSPKQEELYLLLQTKMVTDLTELADRGGQVTIMNILAMMTKLAEAANGWIYNSEGVAIDLPWNPKLEAVEEVVDEIDLDTEKIVIWSRFTHDLHLIAARLRKIHGEEAVVVIHGGDHCKVCGSKKSRRFEDISNFNNAEFPKIAVINQSVGAHGIDLTRAGVEIFYSNSFVKTDRIQSEDRCHRIGMQDHLTIVDLVCEKTIDEAILDALRSHKGMTLALLGHLGVDTDKFVKEASEEAPVIIDQQRNEHGECVLSSICMLANKQIEEGRTWVKDNLNRNQWNWNVGGGEQQDSEVDKLLQAWNINLQVVGDIPSQAEAKGMIRMTRVGLTGHRVVFANNLIYDPNFEKPKAIPSWLRGQIEDGYSLGTIWKVV